MPSSPSAVRSYRIYLRDRSDRTPAREVNLASDHEAREYALVLLTAQTRYLIAEVWDRARLVCKISREEIRTGSDRAG
jgi:hypothetical protein